LGLEILPKENFDMILMDISLPGMDCKQATQLIRKMDKHKDLPIIALTAHAIKGEHESIVASGVTDLVTKPVDEEALMVRIKELLP